MIPVAKPNLGEAETREVLRALRSGWISSKGPAVSEFEARWAAFCGRKYAIALSSGTAALQMAIAAMKFRPGDEVILPSFTMISTVAAVLRNGLTPILVDVNPQTWCMDVNHAISKVSPRTVAILPVHVYGNPVDMTPLLGFARQRRLAVIEDAAEAHGARYVLDGASEPCGSFGEVSCFSFYANKLVTTGEGGMALTNDAAVASRIRSMASMAFGEKEHFAHASLGWNYRMSALQAAVGVAQIEKVDELLEGKAAIASAYREAGISGVSFQAQHQGATSSWWMTGLVLDDGMMVDAKVVRERMAELGIETRPFFLGMHEQPALRDVTSFKCESYPVTEHLSRQGLYLPSWPGLTGDQLWTVISGLRESIPSF